jgi:hypothetical protein
MINSCLISWKEVSRVIRDILVYWENKLSTAKPAELKGLLTNMMRERRQYDLETEKALVALNDRYAPKE